MPDYGPESGLQQVPVHVKSADGSSTFGLILSIVFAALDIFTDILLALALHAQALAESDDGAARQTRWWFVVTVIIIIVPMVVVNCFSLLWYFQNRKCLGDYCVLHKMSTMRKLYIVVMHTILLGPIARYIDLLLYKYKRSKENRQVMMDEQGALVNRLTPKGEVFAVMQMVGYVRLDDTSLGNVFGISSAPPDVNKLAVGVIARDSAMLEMLHGFLQDAPQLVFQIFLLYRSPNIIDADLSDTKTVAIQLLKIALALLSLARSLVSYQEELRRGLVDKPSIGVFGVIVCVLWRMCMVAARVIVIGSFSAIVKDSGPKNNNSGWLGYKDIDPSDDPLTYPVITACIFGGHWLVMAVWIHAQVIVVTELWFRASIVFTVECSFLVGVCCLLLYYGFIHPKAELPEEQHLRFHR
ncbi:hypothetical protein HAZT_HAZT001641 [Hyalella azteca]|uniref:XK-related protein n=1 Tax=Hyalella azteca TaxID=294128 RepID=A0A6A0GV30_HYAAZ|nr:hypothetical protein HAZT_HAZT001641 [Hyalella azteca]